MSYSIQNRLDSSTEDLVTAMGLPLVDGVYATLVLTGVVGTLGGIVSTGMLIFGGSLVISIIVTEMAGDSAAERLRRVMLVGTGLIPAAAIEAVLAPTVRAALAMGIFKWFGAAVIMTLAFRIAHGELLPAWITPSRVALAGVVVSLRPFGVTRELIVDPSLVGGGVAAATLAIGVASMAAVAGPKLDELLDIQQFRFGAGVALALIPLSIYGLLPSAASLAALGFTSVFAIDTSSPTDQPTNN